MRRAPVVLLFVCAVCASIGCARRVEFAPGERPTMARDKLPKVLQPLVPERGLYAAGGGLTSAPWRVTLSLSGELRAARSDEGGSFADMKVSRKKLDDATLREVVALADRAWRETRTPPAQPNADYDEILIFADGKDCWLLEGFGPLEGGAAEELVARLRKLGEPSPPR